MREKMGICPRNQVKGEKKSNETLPSDWAENQKGKQSNASVSFVSSRAGGRLGGG